jgi:hypothetical protein
MVDERFVGTSSGMSVCLGGYQALRLDCWLALPSAPEAERDTYDKCYAFVNEKLEKDVNAIYEMNRQIKGKLRKLDGED